MGDVAERHGYQAVAALGPFAAAVWWRYPDRWRPCWMTPASSFYNPLVHRSRLFRISHSIIPLPFSHPTKHNRDRWLLS